MKLFLAELALPGPPSRRAGVVRRWPTRNGAASPRLKLRPSGQNDAEGSSLVDGHCAGSQVSAAVRPGSALERGIGPLLRIEPATPATLPNAGQCARGSCPVLPARSCGL